jgi:ketosteroid isomerase-like protein
MTRTILLIVTGYAVALTGLATPTITLAADQGNAEQEVMQLERSWCSATLKGDVATVSAILADDYTDVVLNTGAVAYKAQTLAEIKPHKATVCEVDMLQIRIYGDAAVVIGRATEKSARFTGQYRYTDTYIRRDGHWRCVASQSTEIKP